MTDVRELIRLNEGVLKEPILWAVDGAPWPQQLVVIGDNECGDLYAIDTEDPTGAVYFYDHETGELETHFESLDEFRSGLLRDIEEFNDEP